MDTREKILPIDELPALLQSGNWVIAVGQFDPLTAAQAKRLSALRTPDSQLLAIIQEDALALLPVKARAALIAALRDVDVVTVAEHEGWRRSIPPDTRVRIVEDAQAEKMRSADFARFVVDRQRSANEGPGQ